MLAAHSLPERRIDPLGNYQSNLTAGFAAAGE
jgi:hypothetical protein